MTRFWGGLGLAGFGFTALLSGQNAVPSVAQSQESLTAAFHVSFSFERPVPGIAVPRYSIEIREDGTGRYRAEIPAAQSSELQIIERPLVFSSSTVKGAHESVHMVHSSASPCASRLKNIADTGTKTLIYRDANGDGTCTYNHTENKGAIQLTELFQGIELTLEEGRVLDFKHRFDRLGLDAEMATLVSAVDAGHALELENIAPTLRSIASDTELIERVRLRAAKLLERAETGG